MNVILLSPTEIKEARDKIIDNIKENPVFVAPKDCNLYEYIPQLELKEKIQSRMCICKELKINVMLNKNHKKAKYSLLSELLKNIDTNEQCEVVVLGDIDVTDEQAMKVRYSLCEIIQQFIYMNIQLSAVHVCTEKEFQDNEKILAFEKSIDKHKEAVLDSIERVNGLKDDEKNYRNIILQKLESISNLIEQTKDNELRIAVAATKKSGKSVIVNSMIEYEIAPTSLELATPNNCIYRKSKDNSFHLKYKGKGYKNDNAEEMRYKLNELFTNANKDYESGLGIPDMELWYPSTKNSFSTYTIYDTPGPNLANATAHKEAARRGVNSADVIIFTIDYSKYLTDDEYEYIKEVWKMCQKKGKNYSLILNVNKLDLRYDDGSDKSVVRIVDFIRNKLISTGKVDGIDFRGCVVVGTSALTYFNALTAPTLKCPNDDGDCRCLINNFTDKAMKRCILSYDDYETISADYEKRAISTLQQLRGMLDNAEVWHKQSIASVQEMEEFSGMPNLLSYVSYISTQKARNEKVNNLMFKIDSEYKAIMNLFHIEELMQKLKENKDLLDKAIKILKNFKNETGKILDKEYNDLYNDKYINIYDAYDDKKSVYLRELTKKRPIKLSEIGKLYSEEVQKQVGFDAIVNEVTNKRVNTELTRALKSEYGENSNKTLNINSICDWYSKKLSEICCSEMTRFVSKRKDEMGAELEKEQKAICNVMSFIWTQRLNNFRDIVKKHSEDLMKSCSEQLNIEIPEFKIVFGQHSSGGDLSIKNLNAEGIKLIIEDAMRSLNEYSTGNTKGIFGFFRKIFGKENKITLDNVLKIYDKYNIAVDLQGVYKKNGNLENYLCEKIREPLKADMNDFLSNLKSDIDVLYDSISHATKHIEDSIDETEKYQNNINDIENEKRVLLNLKNAVNSFSLSWNEVLKK